jgi:hypothetical protein
MASSLARSGAKHRPRFAGAIRSQGQLLNGNSLSKALFRLAAPKALSLASGTFHRTIAHSLDLDLARGPAGAAHWLRRLHGQVRPSQAETGRMVWA